MGSFFEDFEEKKKKKAATTTKIPSTLKSTVKATTQSVSPSKAVSTSKTAKKTTTSKTTKKMAAFQSKSTAKKSSAKASALVDRNTSSKGELWTPLNYMQLAAYKKDTGSKKIQAAKQRTTAESRKQTRQKLAEQKEARIKRQKELRKYTLSKRDRKNLNQTGKQLVREAKSAYDAAKAIGDRAGMAEAHAKAELTRKQYGYSGGAAGDEYISPTLPWEDKIGLNEAGIRQVKKARMDYQAAKDSGDKEGMKAAIRREAEIRKSVKYGATDWSKKTDAYGREIWPGDREREKERMVAGAKAIGTGFAGSLLSLRETANQAMRNYNRKRWGRNIQANANQADSLRAKLALAEAGEGSPDWGTVQRLKNRLAAGEGAEKAMREGTSIDPDLLGQHLMRQSQAYTQEATKGMGGFEKFLTETGISLGQNLPGIVVSMIPGAQGAGLALLGGQAAGAKAYELNERGIEPGEAMTRGFISGGIELATEALPLANLAKIIKGKSGTTFVKNVLGQMGIEATEESASYTANYLADKIAKDPNAAWSWQELMENAAAGAVSGGILGTGGSLIGQNTALQSAQHPTPQQQEMPLKAGESGLARDDYTAGLDKKTMDEIDQVSKLLGVQTRFADRVAGGVANASIRGNTVTIERNNPNPVRFLYGHEITHHIQNMAPESYQEFRAIVEADPDAAAQVEETLQNAARLGTTYTREQALDEVAADYAGALIENENLLNRFIRDNQQNKTLLQRLADAFKGLVSKLKGRDTSNIQKAVTALENAVTQASKNRGRLLTGREAYQQANQKQASLQSRRDELISNLIDEYQSGDLPEGVRAEVDRIGAENLADQYLNGRTFRNDDLRGYFRDWRAYEDLQGRYSFKRAGDIVARQAQAMESQGADRETIWKDTGAIRDTKGNWVEEVDDSQAKFYPQGDAKRQGNPDWVRLKELESKMLMGTITQEELAEAQRLTQVTKVMPKGTTLGDYLDHPDLFQAVPGIENTPFRVADMEGKGERTDQGITVNQDLPEDQRLSTTLHETQHELQAREGRPTGSSVEHWRAKGVEDAKGMYRRTAGEIEARETQRRMNMTAQERRENMPDLGWDRAVFAENAEKAMETFTDTETPDHVGAVAMLRANIGQIENMEPVAYVTGKEIPTEGRITDRVMEYLDSIGRKVERPGFGVVTFSKSRIKNSFVGHGIGNAKIELMAGVPGVIANGKQIGYAENWKGRGYHSYVFAAPVAYKGDTTYLTAIVTEDKNGKRYYLHEVVDQDGNVIFKKRTELAPDRPAQDARDTVANSVQTGDAATFKTGATAEAARLPGDAESPSKTSIPGNEGESNGKFSTKGLSSYERAYQMVYGKKLHKEPETVQEAAEQESVGVIDRLQRMEVTPPPEPKAKPLPTAGDKPPVAPSEIQEETVQAEDLAYMDSLLDSAQKTPEDRDALDQEFQAARDLIPGGRTEKIPLKEKTKDILGFAYRKMVDAGDEIRKAGKQAGDKYLYYYYNQAKASTATAQNMIAMRQSDVNGKEVGESLVSIFGPIKKKGQEYFIDFHDYLLHRHNIYRMGTEEERQMQKQATRYLWEFDDMHPEYKSMTMPQLREAADGGDELAKERLEMLEEKARWDKKVKPVFGYDMTPDKSRTRVKEYEGLHPEFKELAERVYQYNRNLMQYRVDSGLISQETADFLQEKYPDYVPTFHKQDGVNTAPQTKGTRVGKTVKTATGAAGNTPFIDLDKSMAQQTMNVVRESAKNRFGQRLLSDQFSQDYIINVESLADHKQKAAMEDEDGFRSEQTNKDNTFTVYQDGKAYEITMTPAMYEGIKSLSRTGESDHLAVKAVIGANNVYKKAITAWNPVFTGKNFLKDLQDSLLYSTNGPIGFLKNYIPAWRQIVKNGDEWKLYQALGGTASSVYNYDKGVELPKDTKVAKFFGAIQTMNLAVEQAPRLAEFMGTVKKGSRTQEELMEAMYKAADITTNFGRSGDWTKTLNSSFVPFLNPSIQGFDKIRRTIVDNTASFGAFFGLISKAAVLGIAPAIINYALCGDDDDFNELNQRDIDNNYMIKLEAFNDEWKGLWLKVPKGRALAAIGAGTDAGINAVRGKVVDPGELIDTVWTNIGVINPFTGHILKGLTDADIMNPDSPGKTWYGSDIESQAMQNKAPGERYNEKTDMLSKAVGQKLGVSPAKLNYLLDSYTGVFGDILLPYMTPTDASGVGPYLAKPWARPFVLDSVHSNRLSGDFYDLGDELKYADQSGSGVDKIASKYWNKMSEELSNVNEDIRKMERDHSLDYKEKRQKYRDLKEQANQIMRETMANMKEFRQTAAKYTENMSESTEQSAFLKTVRDMFGAEKALEFAGKDVYEKAQEAHEVGVSYDTYLDFRTLNKQYHAIDETDRKLTIMQEEETTGVERDLLEWKAGLIAGSEEAQSVKNRYTGIGNGWNQQDKDEELALVESMELPEEEAFALWKTEVADQYDLEDMEELELKGLPAIEYYRYRQAVKFLNGEENPSDPGKTKTNSKKNQRLPVINSLNLTSKQKDLLYLLEWKPSGLYAAPWH